MKRLIFFIPVLVILFAAIVLIVYENSQSTVKSNSMIIVAGENFWGNIAMQIAGNKAQVISIISNPNQDPHEYESTSTDAKHISEAAIVIENGAGYDTFMDKILSTTTDKTVINAGNLNVVQDGDNPHMWYNLTYVERVAFTLEGDLARKDPKNASIYAANYNKFIVSLSPIETLCQTIDGTYAGTEIIATERVADYMLTNCGLRPIQNDFQKAIEEGYDPSFQSVSFFQGELDNHSAKVLIYNEQTVSSLTDSEKSLAVKDGIPVVGVTETMPVGKIYQTWMLGELEAISTALQNIK